MSLSDDVASLKVGVHKLAVAIEELAIRKYVQGEIDISKLPWFTPQYVPGDSIKLSGSRLPTATVYSDNNEVIASPTPSFRNTSDNSLGAPKVFDKMLEPNSCSNQLKNVATHFGGTQTPTAANLNLPCDNDADANLTMVSLNAFEKDTIHGGDSQRYANGVVRVNSQFLTPNFGVDDKLSDVHEHLSDCKLIPKPQLQSAHKVLDELPIPTFILEMAQAAKATQKEGEEMADAHQVFDTMPEPTKQANMSQIVCQAVVITNEDTSINNDYFTHKQQLFDTPDALNASYFHDMVIIKANQKHILLLQSLISPSCAAFDQTHNEYGEFYSGNSYYLEYPYLQVTSKPSPSFIEIGSRVLYKGAMNIDYDDLVWNMISEPICFCRFVFDPGVLLKWVSNSEFFPHSKLLELKIKLRENLHCKEVHSGEKLEVEVDILEWMDNLVNTFQLSYFHNFVNCLPFSAIHYQIVRIIAFNNHAHMIRIHLKTLNSCGSCTENTDLMIIHYMDLEPCLSNVIHNLSHGLELVSYDIICPVLSYDLGSYMSTSKMSDQYRLFDPGILVSYTLVLFVTYTFEDKGDFRGEEDKVYSLEVFDPGGECLGMICDCLNYVLTSRLNRLSSKCYEGIEAQFKVFDPGPILANVATLKLIDVSNNYVPLPCDHACIGSDNKVSFQMKNYDLRGMKMIKITRFGPSYLDMSSLNLIQYGKNLLSGQSTCMYLEFTYESSSHLVGSQLGSKMYGVANGNHEVGYYEALIALYATIDMKSFAFKGPKHSSVSFFLREAPAFMSHIAPLNATELKVIFVFDPGGYESGLKMRSRPRICGSKGVTDERYNDHQVYVFDPGGSLIIQVSNAMCKLQNLRSAMLCLCFIWNILLVFDP